MKKSGYVFFAALTALILSAIYFVNLFHQRQIAFSPAEQISSEKPTENPAENSANVSNKQKIADAYGKLPLHFEPNVGQTDARVDFIARGQDYALFLTGREAVLSLEKRAENEKDKKRHVVKMKFEGANEPRISGGLEETGSKTNYLLGNDSTKWRTDVSNFAKVKYSEIYNGVDVVYYGNNRKLEYDFIVAPNADPKQIRLAFDGIKNAKIEKESGDLLLETGGGTLRQHAPIVYQNIDGERKEILASYEISKNQKPKTKDRNSFEIKFNLSEYDRSKELIIDPILAYGSYLGGLVFDEARGIAVDSSGNAYIVGTSYSLDFPTTAGSLKPNLLPMTNANQYRYDAFVTKVNPTGTALVYSTYFGGRNGHETGIGAAVDAGGNVLVSGLTMSADFPLVNAYSSTYENIDMNFAAKLNANGTAIIYSTYLGTSSGAGGKVAVNPSNGDAVFAGTTGTPFFPTTPGAYKPRLCETPQTCQGINYSGSYIVKFTANGNAVYSTLFDAGLNDVALDANGNAVVGGTAAATAPTTPGAFQPASSGGVEGYIAKLNASGSSLLYATFLGGGLQSDRVRSVAVDSAGSIYATGQTQNTGFPTTEGAFDRTFNGGEDGFVTKFNPSGSALVYSTFLGGAAKDEPFGIGLGADNSAFVAGETLSPTTFPLKNSVNGTNGNIFVTHLNADGSALVYSTLLGQGGAYDIAVDQSNGAYITGHTTSIVVTPNSFQPMKGEATSTSSAKDAFVIKLAPTDENVQTYSISGTVTDPTQFGNYQPITVTLTGTVTRSIILPYGSGNGVIPYFFGNLPAGGNYTVTVRKIGFTTDPENVTFNNLGANQFADFTIQNNEAPEGVVTSPTHGTTFNAPATISITATASDPDGDAIAKVDFVAYSSETGSINLGTDTTAPYEFTWTNVPVGTWSINAYPTDSKGLRGDSTPVVHVFVVDPTGANVSFISPTDGQTFVEGDYVPIAMSVSSSVNLVEVRDQTNALVGRMTASPWTTTWRVMDVGTHTLKAKAYTQNGDFAESAPVNITVNPINHRISGRIRDNITNNGIAGVTLNLTSPTNPSITAQTVTDSSGGYLFTGLGTTPNDGVVITPSRNNYAFNPPTRNINYLGYIEWTNQNFTATAETQISVELTSPTEGQIFTAPATINLAANASSGAGAISKVEFFRRRGAIETLVGTDTTAPFEFQDTNVAENYYSYYARATDATNAVKNSAEINVRVTAAPTVIRLQGDITNAAGNWMQGITVRLTGTANGNPVNQTSVSNFFGAYGFGNLPIGGNYTITPEAPTMTFTPPSFTVTNATQDNIDVDFQANGFNQAPTVQINSPTNGGVFTIGSAIPFNVAASDTDGQVVHLTVTAVSPTRSYTVGQSNNGNFNAPWSPTEPGAYTIYATALDNGGLRTTAEISITVNPPSPVSISGRIVDRGSIGIEGVLLELKDYPNENNVVATATTDASGNYSIPNITTFSTYVLRASKQDYTFSPRQRLYFNIATSQTNADFTGVLQIQPSDFDGDRQSDVAVWRPSSGVWYVNKSGDGNVSAIQFGGASFGDVVAPGNYDGDRKIDIAVFRGGVWYILNSSNNQPRVVYFGLAGDKAVPGDYDGDGKTDIAVWRPSNGVWYIQRSSDGGYDFRHFGLDGDVPLAGDYDGDGKTDLTVWRPSNGGWYVLNSSDNSFRAFQFGSDGDKPLVGDFDGDKKSDFAVFRPNGGVWHVWNSADDSYKAFQWGIATDTPVAGDYDRDGKTDIAVYRKSEGNWYIYKSATNSFAVQNFGLSEDVPIPAAFVR